MELSRRGFLLNIAIGIAAATTAASMPSIASSILQPAPLLVIDPYSKFKIALDIYDADIAQYAYNAKEPDSVMESNRIPATRGIEKMFRHIQETFILPCAKTHDECMRLTYKLLRGDVPSDTRTLLEGEPPELLEQVWPIGIMKLILRDNMTPINYTSTEFKWFHKTYSKFILQDG